MTSNKCPIRCLSRILLLCSFLAGPLWAAGIDHRIELVLQPASGEIRIDDRVQVSGLQQYRFRLAAWLTQVEASVGGRALEVQREGQDYLLRLAGDGAQQIDFKLRGILPQRVAGSRHSGSSHAEDGSYLPGYDDWLPQPRTHRLTYRLTVTVPATHRAVVDGTLLEERLQQDGYRASFGDPKTGQPPSLFAGRYSVGERRLDGVRLRTYFHPELVAESKAYLDAAEAYIERYRQTIGDYPYRDFHIVSAPLPVGLGFSGLTYIDRRIVPLPFMRSRSLAHEVLHNWWGNGVAVDYASGNWAEGLTTYMADYALERDKGETEARTMRVKWLRDYAALPESRDYPVRDFRSKQHQASQVIGYNKAAFVFHMLSQEIGESAFADGLRRFWRKQQFATASWQDLQAAFEQASGRDLEFFFNQWLERRGAPRISLGSHQVTRVETGYLTRIEVLQPVAGYRLQLPVSLQTEAGSERREVTLDATRTSVEWLTPQPPLAIQFDPDSDVFRRLQQDETPPILRDITLDPATQTRIVGDEGDFSAAARALSGRLLDTAPAFLEAGQARAPARPLLLIVAQAQLDAELARLKVEVPADLPAGPYPASAWTARFANGTPLLVVTAESAAELQALLRPLPHYGGQSFALFDGGRMQSRGMWPLTRGALYRDLAASP